MHNHGALNGIGDWNNEEQELLRKTKCKKCTIPCNKETKHLCKKFCPDGGNGH